jgi:hypothetical protein
VPLELVASPPAPPEVEAVAALPPLAALSLSSLPHAATAKMDTINQIER